MDKSEKFALSLSGLLLLVFLGAIVFASVVKDIQVPTCITDVEPFTSDTLFQTGPDTYELQLLARMWAFQPSTIRLPVGSTVDIYLTSQDVTHGLRIRNTNINLMAVPGAVNYARVTFDKPGEYFFACHEFCGAAHQTMSGRFIIEEEGSETQTGAQP